MSSHEQLVENLIEKGVLRTPAIIEAFRAIDRRDFVPKELAASAYLDIALPIGEGQTISQPYTVAFMLELLQPEPGQKILEVGSGSGWQTALLAAMVGDRGQVVALELVSTLCTRGQAAVGRYGFIERGVVEMRCQSGIEGYMPLAPYGRIVAAAAGERVPPAWLAQTAVGGRIVTPVGSSIRRLVRVSDKEWQQEDYPGFAFVPLIAGDEEGRYS